MGFEQDESEAEVSQRKHSGWNQVAFEARTELLPVFSHAFALVRNARLVFDLRQQPYA